jgi:hypothetical protein
MPYISSIYTFKFKVKRDGKEIELSAEFDITLPVKGVRYTKNGDGFPDELEECYLDTYSLLDVKTNKFWDGKLTSEEIKSVESEAYKHALETEFGKY